MRVKQYARALWLAALVALVAGGAAGCVAPATETPPAATQPPTAVSPQAATVTAPPPAETPAAAASPTAPDATASPAGATAPAETPGAMGTATPCCVGERCVVDGVAFTVREVNRTDSVENVGTPQPSQTFLVADVTIEVVGDEAVTYNPQVFRLCAGDETEHNVRAILPDESGTPGPGEEVHLRVVFEVPEDAGKLALVYSPPELQPQEAQVDLECSQPD